MEQHNWLPVLLQSAKCYRVLSAKCYYRVLSATMWWWVTVTGILIGSSYQGELTDLMSCCPYPSSPCSVQHGCCIQLCAALDQGLGLRSLSGGGSGGCCPPSDPCGETVEAGNCMLCDCEAWGEEDPFHFDTLSSGFNVGENNTTQPGPSDLGLERESGKGFEGTDAQDTKVSPFSGIELFGFQETSVNLTEGLGLRSGIANNDFSFDIPEKEEDEDEVSYLVSCCSSPSSPCSVQHTCCIQLCSALEPGLAVRGALDTGADGCCPQSDPCGEQLESGNCIHCNCNYDYYDTHPVGDTLRSSFGDSVDLSDYQDYGIVRESGHGFQGLEVKVGFTGNDLTGEGERFDRVNRDSGPADTEEGSGNGGEPIRAPVTQLWCQY